MHCSACATRIQRSLVRLPAVASASVNLATTRAFVSYDPGRLTPRSYAGRSPTSVTAPPPPATGPARPSGQRSLGTPGAVSWPLAIAALVVSLAAPETPPPDGRCWRWPSWSRSPAAGRSSATAPGCSGGRHQHGHPHRPGNPGRAGGQRRSRPSPSAGATSISGGSGAFAARLHGVMAP